MTPVGVAPTIWQAPCETWQIDFAADATTFGPRMTIQLNDALEEHAADCVACSTALRDQLAERDRKAKERAEATRLYEERRAYVNEQMPLVMAALDRVTAPAVRAVLDLHAKDVSWSTTPRCNGCDQGCSCDSAEWPCSTVETVAKALGLDWPDDAHLWRQS